MNYKQSEALRSDLNDSISIINFEYFNGVFVFEIEPKSCEELELFIACRVDKDITKINELVYYAV